MLKIAQLGQPVLRTAAADVPVEEIGTPEFQAFLAEMLDTLEAAHGAGLAAPQVSTSKRVFLAAILPPEEEDGVPGVEAFINPRLTFLTEEKANGWEGCLSFPELLVLVPRYRALRVDYLDLNGNPRALELHGFPARVIQHEYDHLEGILTLDRAESTRDIIKASEIQAVLGPSPAEDDEEAE